MSKKVVKPSPQAYSWHQDFALALCRAEYGACPYNSIKDGSPNCDAHVRGVGLVADQQCEPGAKTHQQAIDFVRLLDAQETIINAGSA